ncbi:MAG: WD40 repeat domain-containing protein, partial [Vicinamibacterales bacterium]
MRLRRAAVTGLAALTIAVGIAATVAWRQRQAALEQARIALARQLAVQGELIRTQQIDGLPTAALLAVESLKRFPNADADFVARYATSLLPRPLARVVHKKELDSTTNDIMLGFTPDGAQLVTVSGQAAHVWDAANGKPVSTIEHHTIMRRFAMSPDGSYLATTGHCNEAHVWADWKSATPREVARLGHGGRVYEVTFSPSGKYIATTGEDETARIWSDWQSGPAREVAATRDKESVMRAAFSSDEQYLVTAGEELNLSVWRTETGERAGLQTERAIVFKNLMITGLETDVMRVLEPPGEREVGRIENIGVIADPNSIAGLDIHLKAGLVAMPADETVSVRALDGGRQVASLRHTSN